MTDVYVDSENGSDSGSGSRTDPWHTFDHAIAASGVSVPASPGSLPAAPNINLLAGVHTASWRALQAPCNVLAPDGGVQLEPHAQAGPWTQIQLGGQAVWRAPLSGNSGRIVRQAAWQTTVGQPAHRIPVWTSALPLGTATRWASAVLSLANLHTRWGLWSSPTDVYLIPPVDGSWIDPNSVRIITGTGDGLQITGDDVHVGPGIWLLSHDRGIYLDWHAHRAVLDGVHISHCKANVAIAAGGNAWSGWLYGSDHQLQNMVITDDGMYVPDGQEPNPNQGISWFAIKSSGFDMGIRDANGAPVLVYKPLSSAETSAIWTRGGAQNMTIQDCTMDGTFDGLDHWSYDGEFDQGANLNLHVLRCRFRRHGDDGLDISRHTQGLLVEDCTFHRCGTVVSPAPFWGSWTLQNCRGWDIGEGIRVPDGFGKRPPGSIFKLGNIDPGKPQGGVTMLDSQFYSSTPTTQGISQDGGTGARTVKLTVKRSTFVVGYICANWPYTLSDLVDEGNVWATFGTRPLKPPNLPIVVTPAEQACARFYDPANGNFSDAAQVVALQGQAISIGAEIAALEAEIAANQAQLASVQSQLAGLVALGAE